MGWFPKDELEPVPTIPPKDEPVNVQDLLTDLGLEYDNEIIDTTSLIGLLFRVCIEQQGQLRDQQNRINRLEERV